MFSYTRPTAYVYTFDAATGGLKPELMRVPGGCASSRRSPTPPSPFSAEPALPTLGRDTQGLIEEVLLRRGEVVYFVARKSGGAESRSEGESGSGSEKENESGRTRAARRAMREVREVELMARRLEEALLGAEDAEDESDEDDEDEGEDDDDDDDDDDESDYDDDEDDEVDEDGVSVLVASDDESEVESADEQDEEEIVWGAVSQTVESRAVELFGDEDDWEAALFGGVEDEADHMDVEGIKPNREKTAEPRLEQGKTVAATTAGKAEEETQRVVAKTVEQWTHPEDWRCPILPLASADMDVFGFGFGAKTREGTEYEAKGSKTGTQETDPRRADVGRTDQDQDRRAERTVADARTAVATTKADVDSRADPRIRADPRMRTGARTAADQRTRTELTLRADQRTKTAVPTRTWTGTETGTTGMKTMANVQDRTASRTKAEFRTRTEPGTRADLNTRTRADAEAVRPKARTIIPVPMRTKTSTAPTVNTTTRTKADLGPRTKIAQAPAMARVKTDLAMAKTRIAAQAKIETTTPGPEDPAARRGKKRKVDEDEDEDEDAIKAPQVAEALARTKTLAGLRFKKAKTFHSTMTAEKIKTAVSGATANKASAVGAGVDLKTRAGEQQLQQCAILRTGTKVRQCLDGYQKPSPQKTDVGRKRKNDERDDKEEGELSDSEEDMPLAKRYKSVQVQRIPAYGDPCSRGLVRPRSDYGAQRRWDDKRRAQMTARV